MLNSTYLLIEAKLKRLKDYVNTTVTNSINTLTTLVNQKVNRAGDTVTGEMKFNGTKQVTVGDFGHISSGTGGDVLIGQNCYIDRTTNSFRFLNTHVNMGARGVLYKWDTATNALQPFWFDMGRVTTTKDVAFTPVLKKIWHEGNLAADTFASTFAKKAGDTYTGTHTMNGTLNARNGKVYLPVGVDAGI